MTSGGEHCPKIEIGDSLDIRELVDGTELLHSIQAGDCCLRLSYKGRPVDVWGSFTSIQSGKNKGEIIASGSVYITEDEKKAFFSAKLREDPENSGLYGGSLFLNQWCPGHGSPHHIRRSPRLVLDARKAEGGG